MFSGEQAWSLGRRPALDGLRAVAVLLVLACHSGIARMDAAGTAGVTVFFTLSGFLITSLLLEERTRSGAVRLARFYARRARRLGPALAVYLLGALVCAGLGLGAVHPDTFVAAVVYVHNWVLADHLHPADLTGHLWTLSIEEQFYLLWPLALGAIAALRRSVAVCLVLAAAAGSLALRIALWTGDDAQAWRVYFGSDTRADALLLGCALALAMHHRVLRPPAWVLRGAAAAGLALVLACCAIGQEAAVFLALPALVAVGSVAAVWSAAQHDLALLSWAPLRWVGRRSYAAYLWQAPALALVAPLVHRGPGRLLAVTAATLLAAELSWRLVERHALPHREGSGARPDDAERAQVPTGHRQTSRLGGLHAGS